MTENYEKQCVEKILQQHSKALERAATAHNSCRSNFSMGGTALGLVVGLAGPPGVTVASGMAGGAVGTLVGQLVCEHLSGLDEAVKPPVLTHCEPPPTGKSSGR